MCLLCHPVQTADSISLVTARRAGGAGRNGSTVGTYIRDDLDGAERVRRPAVRAAPR
jgi:hypothetical protein